MNLYILVEGRSGERIVYPKWLSIVRPELSQVYSIADLQQNNYYLISGNGYPQYFRRIDSAIEDCNASPNVDALVIAVDAEDETYDGIRTTIIDYVGNRISPDKLKLIIQYPCLETWALGNRIVCRRNPQDAQLRTYIRLFDVRAQDPELLPPLPAEELNRCQFAFVYLKRMLNDRFPRLTYTKSNPTVITHEKYFEHIWRRRRETGHIHAFGAFIETFNAGNSLKGRRLFSDP
jgi:hypothetical protein